MNRQLRIRCGWLSILFLSLTSGTSAAAEKQAPHPVAMVVAFREYTSLPSLEFSTASAVSLARELQSVGYLVQLVTDSTSAESVKDALSATDTISVEECDSSEDLQQMMADWCSEHFDRGAGDPQSETPFGLICFSGHGQRRREDAGIDEFLLAPDDDSDEGGVSVNGLRAQIGVRRLPIVLILDCCRTVVEQAEREAATVEDSEAAEAPEKNDDRLDRIDELVIPNLRNRIGFTQINRVRNYPNPVSPVTTYWATLPGSMTEDSERADFYSWLAEGVRWNKKTEQFYARERRQLRKKEPHSLDDCPLEGKDDLSLLSWFKYAAGQLADYRGGSPAYPEPGYVDEIMICASRTKNYRYRKPALNLLGSWNDFPATGLVAKPVSRGVVITRSPNPNLNQLFAVSFFTGHQESLDWKESSLFVDLVAEFPNAPPGSSLLCLIQPGDNEVAGSFLTDTTTKPCTLPYGHKIRLQLPLRGTPDQRLTSMAISTVPNQETAWPIGASVSVTRLVLMKNRDAAKIARQTESKAVNLMTRWWDIDAIPAENVASVGGEKIVEPDQKVESTEPEKQQPERQRILKLKFHPTETLAGRGGPIYSAPYLDKNLHDFHVILKNTKTKNGDGKRSLTIRVYNADEQQLLSAELAINAKTPQRFPFTTSGFADYIAIVGENIQETEVAEIAIVPRSR